jgi:glutathione S-transferase
VHHKTSPINRGDDVIALNPLGKVSALVTNKSEAVFKSTVICTY